MRFLLVSRDGDHPIEAELARIGHEVVVVEGPEVTAATISLVDVLVIAAAVLLFWKFGTTPTQATLFLIMAGFFIYGPQALIGITAANLATKRAAATKG